MKNGGETIWFLKLVKVLWGILGKFIVLGGILGVARLTIWVLGVMMNVIDPPANLLCPIAGLMVSAVITCILSPQQ